MQPRAVNAHVAYVPGIGFYADGNGREYMRLSYCYPEPDQIREGVRRLARVIEAELDLHSTFDRVDTGTLPGRSGRHRRGCPTSSRSSAPANSDRYEDRRMSEPPRSGPPRRHAEQPHPLRAVVLAGGLTFEREVSLSSGTQVVEELVRAGLDAELRDADAELLPGLAAAPADAVFIALHGATGEDGALRAVLDLAGVPYVGSPAAACRLAWDKPAAKSVVRSAGVATPDWVALPHSTFRELGAGAVLDLIVARLGPAADGQAGLAAARRWACRRSPASRTCPRRWSAASPTATRCWSSGSSRASSWRCRSSTWATGPRRCRRWRSSRSPGVFDYAVALHARADRVPLPGPAGAPRSPSARPRSPSSVHEALGLADLSRTDAIVSADGDGALPRGERLPGAHRDVDVPDGGRGRRLRARRGPRPAARPPGGRRPLHRRGVPRVIRL